MSNIAKDVLWPTDPKVLVRVAMLYVGQGDSSIVLVKDGTTYKTLVVDINRDKEEYGGISVPRVMEDLVGKNGKLDVFVNTHPHNDHLDDITELSEAVDIHEVWHSGHKPGPDHRESYDELQKVIKKVKKKHGEEAENVLTADDSPVAFGEAQYYVLSPEEHVSDEIGDEDPEVRYQRIHEQCAVLKFGKGKSWAMLTGDADREAWEQHIMKHRKSLVTAQILSAPHHGSDSFFYKSGETKNPYLAALNAIDPKYVVVSAPKPSESVHGHPDKAAMGHYRDKVGGDGLLHTGDKRESYICDIFTDGEISVTIDTKLAKHYGVKDNAKDKQNESKATAVRASGPLILGGTKIDQKPMGQSHE